MRGFRSCSFWFLGHCGFGFRDLGLCCFRFRGLGFCGLRDFGLRWQGFCLLRDHGFRSLNFGGPGFFCCLDLQNFRGGRFLRPQGVHGVPDGLIRRQHKGKDGVLKIAVFPVSHCDGGGNALQLPGKPFFSGTEPVEVIGPDVARLQTGEQAAAAGKALGEAAVADAALDHDLTVLGGLRVHMVHEAEKAAATEVISLLRAAAVVEGDGTDLRAAVVDTEISGLCILYVSGDESQVVGLPGIIQAVSCGGENSTHKPVQGSQTGVPAGVPCLDLDV